MKPDAVADATPDATPDALPDTTPDAVPDAVADTTPDAVPDAVADTTPDAVPDAVADVTPDAVPDTTPDAVADTTPDAVADTTPDAEPDAVADAEPDEGPDVVADVAVDAQPDAQPDVAPDSQPDATCTPACDGKTCGDDGCGGTCGTCGDSETCGDDGVCVSVCEQMLFDCVPDLALFAISFCPDPAIQPCLALLTADYQVNGCFDACPSLPIPGFGDLCGAPECAGLVGQLAGFGLIGDQCSTCACTPVCDGKSCGDDDCGGECGVCDPEDVCTAEGLCESPNIFMCSLQQGCPAASAEDCVCAGCNTDGSCGNDEDCVCPDCTIQSFCGGSACENDGQCDPYAEGCSCPDCAQHPLCCVPQCDGKSCGDDGCGGTCGTCADGGACDATGQCLSPCETMVASCLPDFAGFGQVFCGTPELEPCIALISADYEINGCATDCAGLQLPGLDSICTAAECAPLLETFLQFGLMTDECSTCVECVPDCTGKACGDDGCGGSCGACDGGASCNGGQCDFCGGISYQGCCDGEVLYYCEAGNPVMLDCGINPSCGWSEGPGFYDCGTDGAPEPFGTFPKACP
ncbi:MAG: hypothetical protein R3F39_24810 [Myxococcota bacterium]